MFLCYHRCCRVHRCKRHSEHSHYLHLNSGQNPSSQTDPFSQHLVNQTLEHPMREVNPSGLLMQLKSFKFRREPIYRKP